jgi:hypothetical protein
MTFHCPHCQKPISPSLIRAAANQDSAKRDRPGAKGLVRRGCKHFVTNYREGVTEYLCYYCHRYVRRVGDRWRLVYAPKQQRPAG